MSTTEIPEVPLVTIATVCRNAGARIDETAASVAAQEGLEVEWLVVDGASDDDTVARVEAWCAKMKGRVHWISEPDKGIYDAMNKALCMARGEWIWFLNAGDVVIDGQLLAAWMGSIPFGAVLATAQVRQVDPRDGYSRVTGEAFAFDRVATGRVPPHQAVLYRTEAARLAGGYDSALGVAADTALTLRVAASGTVAFFGEVVTLYPTDGVSSRFDWKWTLHRDKARAIQAAAPDWVWQRYRWRWPVEAVRATGSHLLRKCGLLGVWRRVKRAL
jgi:glycosyltransferase involved in cell wall biosynthesis